MLWQAKQSFSQKILAQLYKIEPKLLADANTQAWTNLGFWQDDLKTHQIDHHISDNQDYVKAANLLAQQMGQVLKLSSQDELLDIGCGYGASLQLWHSVFHVKNIGALELQQNCCEYIQKQSWQYVADIFQQSLFEPKPIQCQKNYDVIVSIDATYHYALQDYLQAIEAWLAPSGRVGFHLLIKSEHWQNATHHQQQHIGKKLKWAKVNTAQVLDQAEVIALLQQQGYEQIEIRDLTPSVLQGFANYIQHKKWSKKQKLSLGFFKIYFTARLCQTLVNAQLVQYVQVTAKKIN